MFEQTFVQAGAIVRRPWTMAASLSIQTGMVGILLLLPLIYTDQLQFRKLAEVFSAPSPPPPPAPKYEPVRGARTESVVPSQLVRANTLMEPASIPAKPATIIDDVPPVMAGSGVGVPGGTGVPGATGDGVTGAIADLLRNGFPPPRVPAATPRGPSAAKVTRIRQGGAVQDAKILSRPIPVYPALARQARISGVVQLEAIIGADGRVRELRAVSGHPLLAPAAIEAVRRWLYSPTLLNGDPVEVSTVISVIFSMN